MTRRELLTSASAFIAAGMIPRTFSANTSDLDFAESPPPSSADGL